MKLVTRINCKESDILRGLIKHFEEVELLDWEVFEVDADTHQMMYKSVPGKPPTPFLVLCDGTVVRGMLNIVSNIIKGVRIGDKQ